MPNNKLLLTIAGLSILINTSEDEGYTRELAGELDRDISAILTSNSGASVTNAALLCAIDYLDSAKKSARNANNMRSQVKDYMDDAAKTKFKFDEEHKRANELALEIQSLRSHLTRLATEGDNSGIVKNIKSELAAAKQEVQDTREKAGKIAAANKALNEKSAAMSDCIAGQDKEIARLSSIVNELNQTISKKDEQLAALAARIDSLSSENRSVKSENARLNTELYTIEQSMNEDRAKSRELSAQLAALRLEIEASKNGAGAGQTAGNGEKAVPFASSEVFSAPLSDEVNDTKNTAQNTVSTPILFDYDAPFEPQDSQASIGFDPQLSAEPEQDAEQLTFEDTAVTSLQEEPPVVFDSFTVSGEGDGQLTELTDGPDKSRDMPDLSWTLEV